MSSSSPRVHDRFFKQIFNRPENVRDFIITYLPAEIVAHLDLESLEVVSGNYVEADLGEYFSDVVVKTRVTQGSPADLYFLFEHKSGPERYARVQVLQYMASRWYAQVRDGQSGPLPLIIPVVIYHGTRTWSFSLGFEDLFDPPSSEYLPYIPNFEHILHDISHLNEDEIKGTIVLQAVQLLLKYIQSPELRDQLPRIVELLGSLAEKELVTEYLQVVLEYVFQASEHVDASDVREAFEKLPQGEELMPTIADKLRQEGMQQGMQQGIQQGMQQGELQGKRIILLKQMQRKFSLTSGEVALITSVQDQATLDQALESVLFAQDKSEVLGLLR
ncbi:Rpn family recombination-promoting nuclease/putative transposase [Desulfovermiculus halophilus]|jgi:predicted transposase/invertase (TIGR01784 family)|uniref:Rpn family recombination-promoting nuclease/putative transposase n=1 Tax=Desulfovermiculus halophilus TaxID=339722 RepID=UPI0004840AC0|nr:Rpn family recombination-promoting nuclease/putative transposase [Desulfovermiculus halophilus]